jgi:hypothetical protein
VDAVQGAVQVSGPVLVGVLVLADMSVLVVVAAGYTSAVWQRARPTKLVCRITASMVSWFLLKISLVAYPDTSRTH